MKYQCVILCPDSDAGYTALHEHVQDGWQPIISYTEHSGGGYISNHIVFRKKVKARKPKAKRGAAK